MTGSRKIRLPDELAEQFAILYWDQEALMLRAKLLWQQTIDDLQLSGDWRYVDGWLQPMDAPDRT